MVEIIRPKTSITNDWNELGKPDLRVTLVGFAGRISERHGQLPRPIDLQGKNEAGWRRPPT